MSESCQRRMQVGERLDIKCTDCPHVGFVHQHPDDIRNLPTTCFMCAAEASSPPMPHSAVAHVRSWSCCPMCSEVLCDDDCPLRRLRDMCWEAS